MHDDLGRVVQVTTQKSATDPVVVVASNIDYLPFGPIASIHYATGQVATLDYDNDYRIKDIDTTDGTTAVQDLTYGYDAASDITSITDNDDTARNQTFGYDALLRVTDGDGDYGDIDYGYDAVGNRTSRAITTTGTVTETLTYSTTANQLDSLSDGTITRTFTYTANGNLATDSRGNGFDFIYSHDNRLIEVQENDVTVAEYTHNDLGERVIKAIPAGDTTHYHFDLNGFLIAESTDLALVEREYITLAGLPIAVIDAAAPTTPTEDVIDNDDTETSSTGTWTARDRRQRLPRH